jgi:hypothetical protein
MANLSILLKRERLDEKNCHRDNSHAERTGMIDIIISNLIVDDGGHSDASEISFCLIMKNGWERISIPAERTGDTGRSAIVAVADMYSALTSERPHRPAFSSAEALTGWRNTHTAWIQIALLRWLPEDQS